MIYWISGAKNSGKTTLALIKQKYAQEDEVIVLDGDIHPNGNWKETKVIYVGDPKGDIKTFISILTKALELEKSGKTVIVAVNIPNNLKFISL